MDERCWCGIGLSSLPQQAGGTSSESFKAEKMLLVVVWDCQRLMCVPAPCRGERNIDFEGCRPSVKIDLLGGQHWFYHYFKHEGMNG